MLASRAACPGLDAVLKCPWKTLIDCQPRCRRRRLCRSFQVSICAAFQAGTRVGARSTWNELHSDLNLLDFELWLSFTITMNDLPVAQLSHQ